MKRLVLIVLIALLPFTAAYGQTLEWTNPTTFEDGTAIPQEYLNSQAFIRLYVGDAQTGPWGRAFMRTDGNWEWVNWPGNSFQSDQFVEGKWYTVTFVVQCDASLPINYKDATGAEVNKCSSTHAVPVQYVTTAPPPPPPPPVTGKQPTPPGQLKFR